MSRKVLLIEPNYRNKYPPLSLMKLATYHRQLGDEVTFYKGSDENFAITETMKLLLQTLNHNDEFVNWNKYYEKLVEYLKKGSENLLNSLSSLSFNPLVKKNLSAYRRYYRTKGYLKNPQWDRICITTLFTFYWKKTIEAINFYKQFAKNQKQVFVGGIAASVVPNAMEAETGIYPLVGLLNKGGELDKGNTTIIDNLPLDYSILEEIDYQYPEHDGYYGYMTRGCVNHCAFCVVPTLEPKYEKHLPILSHIEVTKKMFGDKRNLLLLDNNVLASPDFDEIIDEIKAAGFYKGATYIAPNKYDIAINNICRRYNIPAYLKSLFRQYKLLVNKTKDEDEQHRLIRILQENLLDSPYTMTVESVLSVDKILKPKFKKLYQNRPKARYVDFNQGIDARLVTPENMKKLSEIPIRPLRIAFDHWSLRETYVNAVRLAAENGITQLSNYLLYNFQDKPIELYYRMKLNIDLCEKLDVRIYSFPMKYHPIQDPKFFRVRTYLGKYWNRKYIRAIQAILNSTKGKVGRGKSFFEKAFGRNEEEFFQRLYMPEAMIVYRLYYEENGLEPEWWDAFQHLPKKKKESLIQIISDNDFHDIESLTNDEEILRVLRYYTITRDDFENVKKHSTK